MILDKIWELLLITSFGCSIKKTEASKHKRLQHQVVNNNNLLSLMLFIKYQGLLFVQGRPLQYFFVMLED